MEVCRMRDTPVMIFINKMDRDGQDPFDLLDELEEKLQIQLRPLTWPINMGGEFRGVYNLHKKTYIPFGQKVKPQNQEEVTLSVSEDEKLEKYFNTEDATQLKEDVELIEGVYDSLNETEYRAGKLAPVFFGSALHNFGVKELLDSFIRVAPEPQDRDTSTREVKVTEKKFSGFVFKIHANLDPRHRDRLAFLRICSGVFQRNKFYHHVRLNKKLRFSNPYTFLAREKNVLDSAYPGDVVGLFDTGNFKIGDTLTEGEDFYFTGIPSFSPEMFRELINKDPMKTKQLAKGIRQLTDEGVAQMFTQHGGNRKIIGCVGELQFEVIQYRLLQEYGASCQFNHLPFYKACWITGERHVIDEFTKFKQANIVMDKDNHLVYLAQSEWYLNTEKKNNPGITFHETSEIHKQK